MRSDKRRDRRNIRRRDFESFRDSMAERWFGHLAEADERHVYFGSAYAFYVVKGGRMGGHDSRLLEVFYGNRPVDQTVETVSSGTGLPDIRTRFVVESGAALEYHRTERGTVFCLLTPARSEGFSPSESAVVLAHYRSPDSLHSPFEIDAHWRALMSYFECTALDGDPRWFDRFRVGWLRFTRPLIIGGKTQIPDYQAALFKIGEWSFTVGLSGAILFGIQWLIGAPPTRGAG